MPSIAVYTPTIDIATDPVTYTPRGELWGSLTDTVEGYQHVVDAVGGYWTATFTITGTKNDVEEWLESGLGRHIEVYDHAGVMMWEGFVNQVSATISALTVTRGPLMGASNRCDLVYSTVDTSTIPPTVGARKNIGTADNVASQALFGILELYLSSGGSTEDEAIEARNSYLAERALPKTTQVFNLGGGNAATAQVSCLGYTHFLTKFVYNQIVTTGDINASDKIEAIIEAQPNTILSETHTQISANTVQTKAYENDNTVARNLIKSTVALGDAGDNRWLFGVYANRVPYYQIAPTTLDYIVRVVDNEQAFQTPVGRTVMPWNVLPGKWALFSDLLIGRIETTTNLRDDPRAMFIESANYTAPWGLALRGGDTDTINQKLAKMGLSGIGG